MSILSSMMRHRSRRVKIILFAGILCIFLLTLMLGIYSASLPSIIKPDDYRPNVISEVFAQGGEKIGEYFEMRRKPVSLASIPKVVQNAFIAAEDANFYSHRGIDFRGILRATIKNIKARRFVQGGSTITMQVARNLMLTRERKLSRKIKEIILAMRLEKELSKDEILYLYLNEIYLGHGAYGVQAASQNYYGKDVTEITLAEATILAGLPQAPSRYSPLVNRRLAKERQLYVLGRMLEDRFISKVQAVEARDEVLNFLKRRDYNLRYAPHFVEHIRRYLIEKYGYQKVFKEGLQVYTTLDLESQMAANAAVQKGLRALDKRQGYRGPLRQVDADQAETFLKQQAEKESFQEGHIYEAVISDVDDKQKKVMARLGSYTGEIPFKDMRWARKPNRDKYSEWNLIRRPSEALAIGDVVLVRLVSLSESGEEPQLQLSLEQEPLVQAALLSFDHKTSFIKAMVGGFDFTKSEFNRAIQGRRQVGSTFKPFVYGAALERNYTPSSIIVDSPIIYRDGESEVIAKWKPRNFAEKFYGDTTLANGIAYSRNIVTIKIAQDISTEYIADFARRLGITSTLIEDLSMALGSSSISLQEMCRAFAVFAREGKDITPIFITKILDREGNVLEEYIPPTPEEIEDQERVISPALAYLITSLLRRVVQLGTGRAVNDIGWPLAGKTGTTSDYADAWFMGFSPDLLTGVWVGHDVRRKMGELETGHKAAIPIWKAYMSVALKPYDRREFSIPDGIVFVNIDGDTGKLATSETPYPISQPFLEGTEPTEEAAAEATKEEEDEEQFFKEDL